MPYYRFEIRDGGNEPKTEIAALSSSVSAHAQAMLLMKRFLQERDRFDEREWSVEVKDDTGQFAFSVGVYKPGPSIN